MPIEIGPGGTTYTGESTRFLQLVVQMHAVKLETHGIKARPGPWLWRKLREHYQIPGTGKNKATCAEVYEWLQRKVDEERPKQEVIVHDPRPE